MNKFVFKLKNILFSKNFFFRGLKKYDLLIYDDIFPHPVSGFRLEEFSQLLLHFKKSKIVTSGSAYSYIKTPISQHKIDISKKIEKYPELQKKIFQKSRFVNCNTKLFYCIFINTIYDNLSWLEKHKIPFVFTLYPGGGFQIEDSKSDFKLKKVLQSPQFKKVIVTQKYTSDYLIDNNFCSKDKIEFVFGGVVPQHSLNKNLSNKQSFLINKKTLDICFCAAKYMPKGSDKGFDVFIELAHLLNIEYDFIRFHVIGGFDKNEIDVSNLGNRIQFYGYQNFENLNKIFQEIDIIISPNKPFYLNKGAFDGFPLGTVVEAALNGVVALVSDQLKQNLVFENNKEIIIIESNADKIQLEIINLINNPEQLYSLSKNGKQKFIEIYSNQKQVAPRIEILLKEISKIND